MVYIPESIHKSPHPNWVNIDKVSNSLAIESALGHV
jgi:hypothetical protein